VDVCTPTYLHAEYSIAALRAGAHVISEKPMALSSVEAEAIMREAAKSDKSYMVAHVVRFMRAYAYLAEAIQSQKHGKLLKLQLRRLSGTPMWSWDNWFLDKERSGHVILDLMIHDIDFMQAVLGQPNDIVGAHYEFNNFTNYASAIYLYDGCSVSIESGWFKARPPFTADYIALFENGYIILKDGQVNDNGEIQELSQADAIKFSGINLSNADGYAAECRYFIDRVKAGEKPDFLTPESSAAAVRLVEMTIEKAKKV
jgi:predicted dehydrogenase